NSRMFIRKKCLQNCPITNELYNDSRQLKLVQQSQEVSMPKTVVIVGALDTKGDEFAYIKELIEKEGLNTIVVDFGVMGEPTFKPDVSRFEVAQAGGGDLAYLAS